MLTLKDLETIADTTGMSRLIAIAAFKAMSDKTQGSRPSTHFVVRRDGSIAVVEACRTKSHTDRV